MSRREDENLLRRWRQGDGEAFGDLFEIHSSRLYTLAYRLTGREEDARDLLQETALKAFTTGARCHQAAAFYGWIRRILVNQFLDSVRYRSRMGRETLENRADWNEVVEQASASGAPSPRAVLEHQQQAEEIENALLRLDPHYRTVLVFREVEGLSYSQIASELKVPIETVRTRLRRARILMRELLQNLTQATWKE